MIYIGPVTETDTQLLAQAAKWEATNSDLASLDVPRMAEIAKTESPEFATALIYDRILRESQNSAFLRQAIAQGLEKSALPDLVGVVPGALHREHMNTGADGVRILAMARSLGCDAEIIPVQSFGTQEENATAILDWLESHTQRRITLLSLSKGGADTKSALASPRAHTAFAHVGQWISFSGIVQGTPLVGWLRKHPWRWWGVGLTLWWKGYRMEALKQLQHGPGTRLESWPALPPHLRIVHVCGIPLRRHLAHPWAFRAYERLFPLGPNDGGGILLGDLARLPGIVCPVWGTDHYLDPAWDVMPLLRGIVLAAVSPTAPLQASV